MDLLLWRYAEVHGDEPPTRLEIYVEGSVSNAVTIATAPMQCDSSVANSTDVSCVEVAPFGSLQIRFGLLGEEDLHDGAHWLYLTSSRAGELPVATKMRLDLHPESDPEGICPAVLRGEVTVNAAELLPL